MSSRQVVEERLRAAGYPLDQLGQLPGTSPTLVLTILYTTDREIAVTYMPPCDTPVLFDGIIVPGSGVTLLIDREVVADWGLMKGIS